MTLDQYIDNINKRYKLGNATEHTFRGDLQQLLESLVPDIRATNEPKRQSCGAPDYILTKKDIPVGFIEAKDIGDKDLSGAKKTDNKEQFDRYKASLNNLIFTDYLEFHLYIDGIFITKIAIAEVKFPSSGGVSAGGGRGGIKPLTENFTSFENLIKDFCTHIGQTIKSPKKLAEMMAAKARLLSDVIEKALLSDETHNENSTLKDQMNAFKQILIHDITPKGFADVYAQTIAYGMFAARLHDPTLPTFGRQEAAELIPKSNPFLRKLFGYIAGPDLDDRIKWIVDSLVEIFLACNVEEILKNYGKQFSSPSGGGREGADPIIHFYETFLSEYDPKLRKARGVWYTPAPVVNFIVRAVDDILKTEFDLPNGLADNSKTKVTIPSASGGHPSKGRELEVHKVQILDPATGTGTFLAEVVKHIYKKFEGQKGIWSNYVETHLLPRLNGFELLMASYAMAHLKLDLLLTETGYKKTTPPVGHPSKGGEYQRLRVYLTNSLEEHHQDTGTLFANWLSTEANEANHIKRDTPVMCVIGNPPYSVSSTNKSPWIESLTADYKKDLNERNIQPLSDDYIKFIRFGQHFIDKNGSGVLAYISNNSFIDGIIHRQMRKNLLESFDTIYILDLHGNAKKKEICPDGSADQNVFDIMQGVSINIFVKTGKKKKNELGQVSHYDIFGKRDFKYDFLNENSLKSIEWNKLEAPAPNYFFVKKNFDESGKYERGFLLGELFQINVTGVKTHDDNNLVSFNPFSENNFAYDYRPFDTRYINYDLKKVVRHRFSVMKHMLNKNLSLIIPRQAVTENWNHVEISKNLSDNRIHYSNKGIPIVCPLYLYPDHLGQQTINQRTERTPNLNTEIVKQIAEKLDLTFVPEKNSPPMEGCLQGGVVNKEILTTIHSTPIYRNFIENLPFNPALKPLLKDKRKAGILSEVIFWQQVHKGIFHKIDFDRQRIIGNYIVDFYVKTLGLVIEIDGSSHDEKVEYDAQRQAYLENLGLKVYRIADIDVKKNLSSVMIELENYIIQEYGTTPVFDHPSAGGEFAPIDILDYIYAVLHSPTYREKYKEFLKIDFPRVPYPKDTTTFWQLVKLGGEIREIHLLESPVVEKYITQYPIDGNNIVGKIRFVPSPSGRQGGAVYINDTQYFDNVPQVAWEFYIGGYQPAQKWLKDRKERKLEFDDILHYQKIIVALSETDRLMKEIKKIEIE